VEEANSQGGVQYHPLALRALANYCRSQDLHNSLWGWEEFLKDFNRLSRPTVFDILQLQFKSLDSNQQLFFLDIALYGREWYSVGGSDWCTWLAGLHMDMSRGSAKVVVSILFKLTFALD